MSWLIFTCLFHVGVVTVMGRILAQDASPISCPVRPSWDVSSCANATGGIVSRRRMLSDAAVLLPRWAPPASNVTDTVHYNPWADIRHVQAAQGGFVSGGSIGFATGGAQDISNFRNNLNYSYLPAVTDITYNGIVKDYYFDTTNENSQPCADLFCPTYSLGVSPPPALVEAADGPDPWANSTDIYMAVGLDSGIQASEFHRKKLNLVLVLDVSGSMDSSFNSYYYDQNGTKKTLSEEDTAKTKLAVAIEVLIGILGQLSPEDSVSIVLFSDDACQPLPLGQVECMDLDTIKASIHRDIKAAYSTNTGSGMNLAIKTLEECERCMSADPMEWENRVILMTDAETNSGMVSDAQLKQVLAEAASKGIYFTIVGIGLDFSTPLVEIITQVHGANYFSVMSPGDFERRLVDQFNYSVTPLVFDLTVSVHNISNTSSSSGWKILQVYGSPNNDSTLTDDGTAIQITTLFPSPKQDDAVKGGVILLRLHAPEASDAVLTLVASYKDRTTFLSNGTPISVTKTVSTQDVHTANGYMYQSTGVRKAILLARYVDLVRSWLVDQWRLAENATTPLPIPARLCDGFPALFCDSEMLKPLGFEEDISSTGECGLTRWIAPRACILPVPDIVIEPELSAWERQSAKLQITKSARTAFQEFLPYFEGEAQALDDPSLNQEIETIKQIINATLIEGN